MKKYLQFITFLLVIGLCVNVLIAQNSKKRVSPEIAEPFDVKNYEGWQKIDVGHYSLYLPNNLKVEIERGIDTNSLIAKNEQIKVYIYRGNHPPNS